MVAAQMAVDDFGGKVKDRPIEVISGDHQNKPDVGSALARRWFDLDGVDAIFDVPNSAVALAVAQITREKNKAFIASGRRDGGIDGGAMLTEHRAVDLRYVGGRARARASGGRARGQEMVNS